MHGVHGRCVDVDVIRRGCKITKGGGVGMLTFIAWRPWKMWIGRRCGYVEDVDTLKFLIV